MYKMKDRELIIKGGDQLGIGLNDHQLDQLIRFKDLVLERNQSMNLTSIVDDREFIIKHYLDSFTLGRYFKQGGVQRVLDMGTGAGFPGIPLKILYPEIEFILVDSLQKRIHFLKETVQVLGLEGILCIHARAEELGQNPEYREGLDMVVSRAVAQVSVLSEYCLPLVKMGGSFLCLKGPRYGEELEEGKAAITKLGGKLHGVESVVLPFSDIEHYIIHIKKIRQTPPKFPRKPGKPSKNPIK